MRSKQRGRGLGWACEGVVGVVVLSKRSGCGSPDIIQAGWGMPPKFLGADLRSAPIILSGSCLVGRAVWCRHQGIGGPNPCPIRRFLHLAMPCPSPTPATVDRRVVTKNTTVKTTVHAGCTPSQDTRAAVAAHESSPAPGFRRTSGRG